MLKQEQIEKGKKFRKALNKLERDSMGRFLPKRKAYVYGDPNGSKLLKEMNEIGLGSDLSVGEPMDSCDYISKAPIIRLWLTLILISVLVGLLLGLLLIKILWNIFMLS